MANMVEMHFPFDHLASHMPLIDTFLEQRKKQPFLGSVRMVLVTSHEAVFTKQDATDSMNEVGGLERACLFGRPKIHGKPGLPRLRLTLGIMDHTRVGSEAVEIVPKAFK